MIYFIQDTASELIKVGFTKGLKKRLEMLQVGCPSELKALAWMNGSRWDERDMHAQLEQDRERGEWFRVSPQLVSLVGGASYFSVDGLLFLLKHGEHWPAYAAFASCRGTWRERAMRLLVQQYADELPPSGKRK